ncbi:MAG: site-2 protease family protein [Anaerolineales bacterium]|nr:site-2 protease family protein [Anaerolineales bacterium]
MKWSWKLGRFAGIDVYIHTTFLLLVGFLGFSYWVQTRTVTGTLEGLGFLLALFASVVLHEYGHALTARRYGIKTRDITLLPIGGVARLERMPDKPLQELWVALAGPAVNVVIALVLLLYLLVTQTFAPLTGLTLTAGPFIERLMTVNLVLVGFNLLPAFPMDGGRVLRALLALRLEYTRATQIAASIGQGMAFVFGFVGLFINPFLVFIAFFVYIGAQQEASMVQMKSALAGIPVERAMLTEFVSLSTADPLRRAVEHILAGTQQDFPIRNGDQVVGILTRADLLSGLSRLGDQTPVVEVMRTDFDTVHPGDMLEPVFARLQACECHIFPVVQDGRLVGLLSSENIGEFMMFQSAFKRRRRLQQGSF